MKKIFIIFLLLLTSIPKIYAQNNEEIRHLWLHYYRYADTPEKLSEYIERAEALKVNSIFMFIDDMFVNRPDYFQSIIDSIKAHNMKFFIAHSWGLDYDDMAPHLEDPKDYIYRPLNMSEEQWEACINSTSIENRGTTSTLDKNNPNTRELAVQEMMKYFNTYPDIDGIVWDHSRVHGLFGSYHEDAIKYLTENSNLDIEVIKNDVYGALPMPAFRAKNSVGREPVDCKVLAKFSKIRNHTDFLAITLKEHNNNGSVLSLGIRSSGFELPLYTKIAKKAIENSKYLDDIVYVKDGSWRDRSGYEFAYAMDYKARLVNNVTQVPEGAPYIIVDGKRIDGEKAKKLIEHANKGACIIIGEPPYSQLKYTETPPQEIVDLVGFRDVTYVSPYPYFSNNPEYIYITQEGREFGIPETDVDVQTQLIIAEDWMDWNANEMLGGTIRDFKQKLGDTFSNRKLTIGCTRNHSDPWIQQQDWATWLKKGYIDYNTIMLYTNDTERFNNILDRITEYYIDEKTFSNYCQPIIGLPHINSRLVVVEQANTTLKNYKCKGFGFFEGHPGFFDKWQIEECKSIGLSIENGIRPSFYIPPEIESSQPKLEISIPD